MSGYIRQAFPDAWLGVHLIQGSSSWSSWRCDPLIDATCDPSNAEGDDPNRGNEPKAWERCTAAGWCDGLLFQIEAGDVFLNPHAYPNYTGFDGWAGRYWEIAVRLGNDPWSQASSGGNHHGWVRQVDLIAFEFIYDRFHNRTDEATLIKRCQEALAIGGWSCGSASWRR